jgi:16S rRNA (adenine1518-N6/adenine1519-N6)-dimethyltransferase
MSSPKMLLDKHAILPKKSLGQNFIHDPGVLEKIVTIADIQPAETVVEIGPGTGALTEYLAQVAKQVIAVEIDQRLQPILSARFAKSNHVEFVFADILHTRMDQLVPYGDYVVVANLPYYITSAILRHVLETPRRASRFVMTVQLEVAERIVSTPPDMSLLSVSVQYYTKPKIAARLNKAVFYPRPDVDSAVIRLDTHDKPPVQIPDEKLFFRIVRAGFAQKRKQLKNSLSADFPMPVEQATALIDAAGLDPRRRAETLSLEEWAKLARAHTVN